MNLSQAPGKLVLAFGANAGSSYIRTIPVPSQIPITPGAASYTDGFPPLTMTDASAGGVAIAGPDVNGILNEMSAVDVWSSAGGVFPYDATFSAAIGGYPKGAIVLQASGTALWMSTADNNTSDPDTGGANWEFLAPLSLTTTGTGGPATLSGGVLNVPNYLPTFQKQVFTSSGTFTIPAGITSVRWTIVGGGGAGGAGSAGTGGAGGGAGATAKVLATGYTPGNTIAVTVGTGGLGVSGADGGAGNASLIASGTQTITTVTAGGGGGGGYGGDSLPGVGGSGGTVTNGDADSTKGGEGSTGTHYSTGSGSSGGSSSFGGGGTGGYANAAAVNGNPGTAWGSGGGGGNTTTPNVGGNGANGIVIAEWIA